MAVLGWNIMETIMRAGKVSSGGSKLFSENVGVTTVHGADSWTSLVATTYGLDALGRLRVCVRARSAGLERGRLVVQVFSRTGAYARPLAAAQRAVTRDELMRGVEISLHPQARLPTSDEFHVLAWIEAGEPDLEYDGLRAVPNAPVSLGRVRAMRNRAELELTPVAAA